MVTILWIHLIVPPLSDELLRLRFLHGILESLSNKLKTAAVCLHLQYTFLCISLPASATQQRS